MWWPKKKYSELSTMEDISQQLKWDPSSLILRFKRGFLYLKRKNYEKAIDDFNKVIGHNDYLESCVPIKKQSPYFKKIYLYQAYLFRSLAYALLGHMHKNLEGVLENAFFASLKDYQFCVSIKNKKNYGSEYLYLILFAWNVLNKETEIAIDNYSKIRQDNPELMDFEEDIFNLLPIEDIEGLKESMQLIDFNLGIVKKKGTRYISELNN